LITEYYSGDQIEKNKMGGACSRYGDRRAEEHTGTWWENLRDRDHLEDPDVDGRTLLNASSSVGMRA
jgi:hypothetical protein